MTRSLRLLADMNISPLTVHALREAGWDARRVSTPLPEDSSDEAILSYAGETNRVVCTQDLDFSDLLAVSGRERPSLVTLRLSDSSPEVVTARLFDVLPSVTEELEHGAIVIIGDDTVRVRSLPIEEQLVSLTQHRSFMRVDDCVDGIQRIMRIMHSEIDYPINLGSDELVTFNELVDMIEAAVAH